MMIKKYLSVVNRLGYRVSMMRKTGIIITIAFFLLCAVEQEVQGQQKDIIESRFDTYRQNNLQEKIFVHTDKNSYVPGEICWFKLYNVDAYFHQPINLGKVAYVEITDKNNNPVLQAKIALDKGTGAGSFYLPATLASGNYRLRAYTNWMKNFGADYFFEKTINVLNAQKIQPEKAVAQITGYDIAFFPEGGNLINGIQCKVGFKIMNQYGKGVDGEVVLLNEKDDTVTTFHPLKFGIGSFTFTPLAGARYRVLVKLSGGTQQVKALPEAYSTGYAMHLENTRKGQIKITVQVQDKNSLSSPAIYLFVHTRNVIKAVMSKAIQNGQAEFLLNDTLPGDGISQFTIFNENRQPVCERLYFKKPLHTLQIAASPGQPLYDLRKKINIDIASATEEGKPVAANMSMAVYRADPLTGIDEQDISNYLLLSADLTGTVESPGYYFSEDAGTEIAADNLMLTQGWRRFKWEDILAGKKPMFRFFPEINGHIINGKITTLHPGLPVQDIKAYLSVPGTRLQLQTSTADEAGRVKFEMKNFYSDGDIIVQTSTEKDSGYRVEIEPPFYPGNSGSALAPYDFIGQKASLLNNYIDAQVQNTFSYNKLNRSALPLWDTTAFYLKPDGIYLLDNYVRFTTLEEVLREYVIEVNVRQHGGKFHLPVFDEQDRAPFTTSPLALLDGVPVFDFNKLMKYDPLKIRKLEVVTHKYFLGTNSFDGIINFTTYKGDLEGFEIDPRATIIDYEGLQLQRNFYSPVYETDRQSNSRMPDFRNLLYWSPTVITNSNGKMQTNFYSSDVPGRYAIVIQGMSEDGRTGARVAYFDVKKQ